MVKKKSKFRHISINKKKFYFYEIKWFDILGDSGHADNKDFLNMRPAQMVSQGYVFKKDKTCFDRKGMHSTTGARNG